jgi:hypothetical protein
LAPSGVSVPSADVIVYLKMDGSGASFIDSGPNALTVTANGAATQSTVSGALGGKALVCGGNTSDYIGIAANALFSLADFTLNYRLSLATAVAGQIDSLVDIGGYASGFSQRYAQVNDQAIALWYNPGSTHADTSQLTHNANQFYEVELTRRGDTIYEFYNGVLVATVTSMNWSFAASPAMRIGYVLTGGANNITPRTFDDLILTNTAGHTASYTPRTEGYVLTGSEPRLVSATSNALGNVSTGDLVVVLLVNSSGAVGAAPSGWTRIHNSTDANGYGFGVYTSSYAGGNAAVNSTNFPWNNGYLTSLVYAGSKTVIQIGSIASSAAAATSVTAPALSSATASTSVLVAWTSSRDPSITAVAGDTTMQHIQGRTHTYFETDVFKLGGIQSGAKTFTRSSGGSLIYNFTGLLLEVG